MKIELLILSSLLKNEPYMRKVLAFLKPEYFVNQNIRAIFENIHAFIEKYNVPPTIQSLEIDMEPMEISEGDNKEIKDFLKEMDTVQDGVTMEWLISSTENFCKERAIYNALYQCIKIADDKTGKEKLDKNAIPELLRDALGVSFDTNVGHDYLDSLVKRYEYYHNKDERIAFDLTIMNQITGGGIPKKSLSIVAAPTGGGKSIFLCHHAANCLRQNKNVLYITLEMSEERIAERIDANLMNIKLNDLRILPFDIYEKKFKRCTDAMKGKLIIKEYPTGTANSLNFRHLIDELKMKQEFVPDVVIIDYLNICASSRYKANSNLNSYTLIKAIAEELRGLAVEYNVQLFSATQVNRQGFNNSDIDLTNTAESMGLPATADFFIALISTDELDGLNQVLFKQLKNRYEDMAVNRKFIVGLDKSRMKFYDANDSAQSGLVDKNGTIAKASSGLQDFSEEEHEPFDNDKFRKNYSTWK